MTNSEGEKKSIGKFIKNNWMMGLIYLALFTMSALLIAGGIAAIAASAVSFGATGVVGIVAVVAGLSIGTAVIGKIGWDIYRRRKITKRLIGNLAEVEKTEGRKSKKPHIHFDSTVENNPENTRKQTVSFHPSVVEDEAKKEIDKQKREKAESIFSFEMDSAHKLTKASKFKRRKTVQKKEKTEQVKKPNFFRGIFSSKKAGVSEREGEGEGESEGGDKPKSKGQTKDN
jgi:hypothetical protein